MSSQSANKQTANEQKTGDAITRLRDLIDDFDDQEFIKKPGRAIGLNTFPGQLEEQEKSFFQDEQGEGSERPASGEVNSTEKTKEKLKHEPIRITEQEIETYINKKPGKKHPPADNKKVIGDVIGDGIEDVIEDKDSAGEYNGFNPFGQKVSLLKTNQKTNVDEISGHINFNQENKIERYQTEQDRKKIAIERFKFFLDKDTISDIHITEGKPLWFRSQRDGCMYKNDLIMPKDFITEIWTSVFHLPSFQRKKYACDYGKWRLRIQIDQSCQKKQMFLRKLPSSAPTLDKLGYRWIFDDLLKSENMPSGLLLVAGPTGSGKSTLLSSFLQEILNTKSLHILTLEDPIEYILKEGEQGEVSQREILDDFDNFNTGIANALREDIDVLLVGEMRENEVAKSTLQAAQTGHMTVATIHASNIPGIIDRYVMMLNASQVADPYSQFAEVFLGAIMLNYTTEGGKINRTVKTLWRTPEIIEIIKANKMSELSLYK